jgi:hypothetical protein
MIFDLVPFFNELELLKMRMSELDAVVGQFIIVESNLTHKGDPKPLYFADNRSQFDAWKDKTRHIVIDDMPRQKSFDVEPNNMYDDPAWKREWFQMDRALDVINVGLTESVIYTDVDEIPSADAIREFTIKDECVTLELPEHQFFINWRVPTTKIDSCMIIGRALKGRRRAQIRYQQNGFKRNRIIHGAGWHFSSMGGPEMVKQKLNSFCHWNRKCVLEYNNLPEPKASPIPQSWEGSPISKVAIDGSFPKYVRDNLDSLTEKGFVHLPLI